MALNTASNPSSGPALGSPEQFNRRPGRLRDLKAPDQRLNLPPLFQQEDKAVKRSTAIDARLNPGQRTLNAASPTGLQATELAAIERDLLAQKSRARIEKLKDLRSSLELVHQRLFADSDPSSQTISQLRSLIQSAQSQFLAIYQGPLAMIQGMAQVRPLLDHCIQKLDCVQAGKASAYTALCARDASLFESLRAPNAVPVMEKAALIALADTVERVLELFLALTYDPSPSEDEELLLQHQPSLQLLQRATRSQQQILSQLRVLHDQLGELQQLMSLNLLKSSLHQLRNRCLSEWQGICSIIELHLPALAPLVPVLQAQHQRLQETASADLQDRPMRSTQATPLTLTSGLPTAVHALLEEYSLGNEKLVLAFEALSAQTLEKAQHLTHEGQMSDLDALFGLSP